MSIIEGKRIEMVEIYRTTEVQCFEKRIEILNLYYIL